MATKLRRTLFIGLGGTGMNALLHAKKTLYDTYGEIPHDRIPRNRHRWGSIQ